MLLLAAGYVHGQETIVKRSPLKIDENTVFLDSAGKKMKTDEWRLMLMSGNYTVKRVNPADSTSAYTLTKLNALQKEIMLMNMPKPPESPYFNTGGVLDMFSDKAIDGYSFNRKTLKGKIVVLNFWFVDCPPCRAEIPELNKIVEAYKDNPDVVFIAAALDYKGDINKFTKNTPFNYHLVADSRYWTTKWGIRTFPTNVIIDGDGIVRFHTSGFGPATAHWIKKTLDEIKKAGS